MITIPGHRDQHCASREWGDSGKESIAFATVESAFYPDLLTYYGQVARRWRYEHLMEEREDGRQQRREETAREAAIAPFEADIEAMIKEQMVSWPAPTSAITGMGRGIKQQRLRRAIEDHVLRSARMPESCASLNGGGS